MLERRPELRRRRHEGCRTSRSTERGVWIECKPHTVSSESDAIKRDQEELTWPSSSFSRPQRCEERGSDSRSSQPEVVAGGNPRSNAQLIARGPDPLHEMLRQCEAA